MTDIAANLREVQARIDRAVLKRGPGEPVRLVAVSKRHPIEAIQAAYAAGQRDFGENYAQELEQKARDLRLACPEIRWHMIGPVQRNKVPKLSRAAMIHTVDRESLVQTLQQHAVKQDRSLECLVQVNPGEAQKSGISEEALPELLDSIAQASQLRCKGLMLIPPKLDAEASQAHFRWLAQLAEQHQARFSTYPAELSMGMSHDYSEAIVAGATMVRVGSAIFGPRPPAPVP